jgi:cation transport ATPase
MRNVREIFWPLLDKYRESPISAISPNDIKIDQANDLKIAYEMAHKNQQDEQERSRTVETKSIVFISSIGFVITFILGITNMLLSSKNISLDYFTLLLIFTAIILIAYFVKATWFSVLALKRREFKVLSVQDIIEVKENYLKEIIAKTINISKENAKTINLKVDFMTMAQEYYQRAIIALIFYAIFMFIVIITNMKYSGQSLLPNNILNIGKRFIHSDWLQIAFYSLLILNTLFLLVILNRTKSLKNK